MGASNSRVNNLVDNVVYFSAPIAQHIVVVRYTIVDACETRLLHDRIVSLCGSVPMFVDCCSSQLLYVSCGGFSH